jgi:hypothetical protein
MKEALLSVEGSSWEIEETLGSLIYSSNAYSLLSFFVLDTLVGLR